MAYYVLRCANKCPDEISVEVPRAELLIVAEQLIRAYNRGAESSFVFLAGKMKKNPK